MRRLSLLFLAIALVTSVRVTNPDVAVACSCAMVERPMAEAATDPTTSVFTGVAGPLVGAGVAVQLTRWFHGVPPPSGVAVLDPAGFQDPMGGMCGTNPPTAGTEWIFATGRDPMGRYVVNLCTTHAPLDSDQGQTLLAEATTVFGPPIVPELTPPDPVAGSSDPASMVGAIVPIVLVVLFAVSAAAGAFLVFRRRRDDA